MHAKITPTLSYGWTQNPCDFTDIPGCAFPTPR